MLHRFCLYGFLKNQRYFEPFLMLVLIQHGFSFFMIGLLVASQNLTINVLEIPSGVLADTWGRRACMIVSFIAYIACFLLFAGADSIVWFFAAMVLYGIGDSFRTGTHKAMIFEWLRLQGRESERTRVYGLTRSWSKFGSAVSSGLAALFVFVTGDYRSIFLWAIVPYAINIMNVLGYPPALDGAHAKATTLRDGAVHFRRAVTLARERPSLRQLLVESMAWDGLFHAVKDFLQPVLALLALRVFLDWLPWDDWRIDPSEAKVSALLIGITYTALFVLSGLASRLSHRWVSFYRGEQNASRSLWIFQLATYLVLVVADCLDRFGLVALTFVAIHVLQNLWRPILIGRFDGLVPAEQGATMMSMESQSRRLATLIIAPTVGVLMDAIAGEDQLGTYWPIGAVGIALSFLVLLGRTRSAANRRPNRP
jgi:MFS family permease